MTKLTQDNYFNCNNGYLTNSKIGDYLKCPNYFYRKHILCTVERKTTPAMRIGSTVDSLLTQDKIKELYWVGDGRSKEAKEKKEEGFEVINENTYQAMMDIAIAVEETDAYKELKDFTRQDILTIDVGIGKHFMGVAGIPDFYKYDAKKRLVTVVDLKTAANLSKRKYYYHCLEYGYFRQQAIYQLLLADKFPEAKSFVSYHLVVDKTKDIYNVETYELDQDEVEYEATNLPSLFEKIGNEKDFKKYNPSFKKAEILGEQYV